LQVTVQSVMCHFLFPLIGSEGADTGSLAKKEVSTPMQRKYSIKEPSQRVQYVYLY